MPLVAIPDPAEFYAAEVQFAMVEPGGPTQHRFMVTVTVGALDGLFGAELGRAESLRLVEANRVRFETIASAKHDRGLPLRITVNDWIERYPLPD